MSGLLGLVKSSRSVANIACGEQIAGAKVLDGFANENAVHDDLAACGDFLRDELMLGGDIRRQDVVFSQKAERLAFAQICEGHENVVSRIQLQNAALCSSVT